VRSGRQHVGGSAHLGHGDNKNELAMRAIGSEGHLACDLRRELIWLYPRAARTCGYRCATGTASTTATDRRTRWST
jgi:hypothetical protein